MLCYVMFNIPISLSLCLNPGEILSQIDGQ